MYRLIIDGQYVPIPPEKISIKVDGDNKTMTLINLGEVNKSQTYRDFIWLVIA